MSFCLKGIPLTLEPESKFYKDPVAILDFQSLYPSVIMAFNICYTTCLGRIELIGKEGSFKFGCGNEENIKMIHLNVIIFLFYIMFYLKVLYLYPIV